MNTAHQLTATIGSSTCNTRKKSGWFDPTAPVNYAMVLEAISLLKDCADELDSFFGQRVIDVRNNLRGMGWDGERMGPLKKGALELTHTFTHTGAGRNVVGVEYVILGGQAGPISVTDTLHQDAMELATFINLFAAYESEQMSLEATVH